MDPVTYTFVDSVLRVWLDNVVAGHRVLAALVRKRLVCTRNRRGWYTDWSLLRFVEWSTVALASGRYLTRNA